MELNLKLQGWFLSESGLKSVESLDLKKATNSLLDRDLREVGAGISDLHKGKFECIEHETAVLQILKTRNISAPKANENSKTAPKLIKLQLTDGQNAYSAIEMEPTQLSMEIKPGTKILLKLKHLKMTNGQLLLTPKNTEILGGHVDTLVSKWEISRSLAGIKGSRGGAANGPPPFIPFGQKIQQQNLPTDRTFKSLAPSKQKESESDPNSDFNAQRMDAIAEASKAGTKKTFGGGSKTLVDSNVQKIIDKGYTEDQATYALRLARNNVERALSNLKRRDERQQRTNSSDYEPRENPREKRSFGKGSSAEPASAKPSGKVSLFDFLEDKFPESAAKHSSFSNNERFENNISSSFRKPDKDITNKSQHWSQHPSSSVGGNEHRSSQNYKQGSNYNNARDTRDTREYRDGGREQPRDYRNNRDSRESRDGHRDTRDGPRDSKYQQSNNYSSKPNSTASNQYQKPSLTSQKPLSANNGSASYNNNNRDHQSASKGRFNAKPDFNGNNGKPVHQQKESYGSYGAPPIAGGTNNYNSSKPRSNNSSAPSKYYNDHQSDSYQKSSRNVVESMEKMNLKGNQYKGGDSRGNSNTYPPLSSSSADPSKQNYGNKSSSNYPIVGFQNKEGNEHAKNALKTKNIPNNQQQQNWQQPPPSSAAQSHSMPGPVISQQTIKTQPPPPFPASAPVNQHQQQQQQQQQQQAAPIHSLPQPFVQHQAHPVLHPMPPPGIIPANSAPAVYHQQINYPAPIIMQSVQTPAIHPPPGVNPQQLKIGDLCLAKYWEDGQFYNAKITGISDSTYVVLFTEYGNAEEVRKTDCVPLIPACPTPPHSQQAMSAQMTGSYRISQSQKMPTPHNYHQSHSHSSNKNHQRRN